VVEHIVLWAVVICASVFLEAMSSQLVAVWFAVAAVVSLVLAIIGAALWIQVAIFVGLAFVLAVLSRPLYKKYIRPKAQHTNADMAIGQIAIITERVDNDAGTGFATVGAQLWTARSEDGSVIEEGEKAVVVCIDGVKLILNKDRAHAHVNDGDEIRTEHKI